MKYQISFSDPTKQSTITVPDTSTGPGINTVDTSLNLVGQGYPNYGLKFAENFVHLLENFASPLPPENPIEGQLWYDTSDSNHKVLRVMDGTASTARWPSANGIYQQSSDPNVNYTVKNGDIWVDTAQNNLKIWNGLTWQVVGPTSSSSNSLLTGSIPEQVTSIDGSQYWVIKNYVNGDVISIVSGLTTATFTPASVIQGFLQIKPGINMSVQVANGATSQLHGTAENAYNLVVNTVNYASSEFLRKTDSSSDGQEITGKVVFRTTSTTGALGRDGVVILPQGKTTEYVQLYKDGNDGILLNNTIGGKITIQTNPTGVIKDLVTSVVIDPVTGISLTTNTVITSLLTAQQGLHVSNAAVFANDVTIDGALETQSTISAGDDITVGGQLYVNWNNGQAGPAILPGVSGTPVNNTYDIGSASASFRRVYAYQVGTAGITQFYGTLTGTATRLDKPISLQVRGHVTATVVNIQGDGVGAYFTTTLTTNAISDQPAVTTATSTTTMMVLNNGALSKITKKNFLQDVSRPGMIMIWSSATPPDGWLLCDGSAKSITAYPDLFAVTSWYYGNSGANFNVPNLVQQDLGGKYIYYIIKY